MDFECLPKKKQLFIETLGRLNSDESLEERAQQSGIKLKQYKQWLRDPELLRIAYQEYKKEIVSRLPKILEALIKKAEDGDINAIKMVFQQLENFQEHAIKEQNLTVDEVIRIVQKEQKSDKETKAQSG